MSVNWRERVIEEQVLLGSKLKALDAFLEDTEASDMVGSDQYALLLRQREVMTEYYDILEDRLYMSKENTNESSSTT